MALTDIESNSLVDLSALYLCRPFSFSNSNVYTLKKAENVQIKKNKKHNRSSYGTSMAHKLEKNGTFFFLHFCPNSASQPHQSSGKQQTADHLQ